MNPSVSQRVIDEGYEADPSSAAAEYGAQFRRDLEAYLSREIIEICTDLGVHECPPLGRHGRYVGQMTLAVAHDERDGTAVLDAPCEIKPPFSPEAAVSEFAVLLRSLPRHQSLRRPQWWRVAGGEVQGVRHHLRAVADDHLSRLSGAVQQPSYSAARQ